MRSKLLNSKKLLWSLSVAVAISAAFTAYAAGVNDFRLYLQAYDGGCTSQLGTSRAGTFINTIVGAGIAPWATDGNGYDFDCLRINLNLATLAPVTPVTKDFRACLQFGDNVSLDKSGNVKGLNQVGAAACTPWAADGGGVSAWAADSNKFDPDAGVLTLETRNLPAGKTAANDVRFGIQLSDKSCTAQIGVTEFTPWFSQGGGWSKWARDTNAFDPDCGRLTLEVKDAGNACEEAVTCPDQKILSLANNPGNPGEGTQHAVAARFPDTFFGGPPPSIFNLAKDLTYESWIYKIGHNSYGGILTTGVADLRSNGWPSLYGSGDGKSLTFRAGRSNDANQCKGNCREYNLNQEIPTGKWTHVAVTVSNGSTLTWYVNGTQVKQETLANWDVSATPRLEKVYIGNEFPGLPEYPNAQLDEVRVWNVARSAAQIKEAMNKKVSATETGLVNYWNFDNGTGTDVTGHTDALQLQNGATIKADAALSPLKLCTRNICPTNEPPVTQTPPITPPVNTPPPVIPNPPPSQNPSATCTITATPSAIVINVGSSKLEWTCTSGSSAEITDDNANFPNIGNKPLVGSVTVSPDMTTKFTVTAGGATDSATVTVSGSIFDETDGL